MKTPFAPLIKYFAVLVDLLSLTMDKLNALSWQVGPSRFYSWCASVIKKLAEYGAPTFDQPSWLGLVEILEKRVADLEGSYTDTSLTQVMDRWRDFDFYAPDDTPPNPYVPKMGPFNKIVSAYDHFEAIIKYGASALESALGNKTLDPVGRTLTVGECVYVLWSMVRKACDNPWFRTDHPDVPKWSAPYPWLEFVENELRQLKDELKATNPAPGRPIGGTPWSMPEV